MGRFCPLIGRSTDTLVDEDMAATRQGKLGEVGKGQKPLSELELEVARLKRELAEVKLERDLLKKCTAYFVRTSA